jgi:hypothetical protein
MKRGPISLALLSLLALCALPVGCKSKHEEAPPEPAAQTEPAPATAADNSALSAVDNSLNEGAVDEAAARLLKMRASGREFSQKEAAAFRKALDEVYTRALEAEEKGDPRARAALQMIRAATQ